MKKNKKINIEDIKIKSFVTSLDDDEKEKIKGGATIWILCPEHTIPSFFPIIC